MIFTNKIFILKSEFFGFLFGILLVLSQINIVYGLPFILFISFLFSNKIALNKNDRKLFFLTVLQLLWFLCIYSSQLMGNVKEVSLVKFIISLLLLVFALIDLIPFFGKLKFGNKSLPLGGVLSGF